MESVADRALPPSPEFPGAPVPAIVEMSPVAWSTFRIRLFLGSAMYSLPAESKLRPPTLPPKVASAKGPESPPNPSVELPATVEITPLGVMRRICATSVKKTFPLLSIASPNFKLVSGALAAAPPSPLPTPMTVLSVPPSAKLRTRSFVQSVNTTRPVASSATSEGSPRSASVATVPSGLNPEALVPAMIESGLVAPGVIS